MTLTYNPDQDFYEILEVDVDADTEAIKKARIRLAKQFHSDIADVSDDERMKLVNEACDVLSDADRRAEYDALREQWMDEFLPPQIRLSANSVDFGRVTLGDDTSPQVITIFNDGSYGVCEVSPSRGTFWVAEGTASEDPSAFGQMNFQLDPFYDGPVGELTESTRILLDNHDMISGQTVVIHAIVEPSSVVPDDARLDTSHSADPAGASVGAPVPARRRGLSSLLSLVAWPSLSGYGVFEAIALFIRVLIKGLIIGWVYCVGVFLVGYAVWMVGLRFILAEGYGIIILFGLYILCFIAGFITAYATEA